jgi:hypothetical protein
MYLPVDDLKETPRAPHEQEVQVQGALLLQRQEIHQQVKAAGSNKDVRIRNFKFLVNDLSVEHAF